MKEQQKGNKEIKEPLNEVSTTQMNADRLNAFDRIFGDIKLSVGDNSIY